MTFDKVSHTVSILLKLGYSIGLFSGKLTLDVLGFIDRVSGRLACPNNGISWAVAIK